MLSHPGPSAFFDIRILQGSCPHISEGIFGSLGDPVRIFRKEPSDHSGILSAYFEMGLPDHSRILSVNTDRTFDSPQVTAQSATFPPTNIMISMIPPVIVQISLFTVFYSVFYFFLY